MSSSPRLLFLVRMRQASLHSDAFALDSLPLICTKVQLDAAIAAHAAESEIVDALTCKFARSMGSVSFGLAREGCFHQWTSEPMAHFGHQTHGRASSL
jgi:hypothetical protein